jgi:hypothetical protein
MTPQAYLYICDGDIDDPVLTQKKMDWPEKYPHWQEIPLFMAQRTWVNLTNEEIGEIYRVGWANNMELARAIEAKLKEKNT